MIKDCPVCYETITSAETLPCGHLVHEQCIINSGKAACPICRMSLSEYNDKVVEIKLESPRWGTLDKLVSLGWLKHAEIPIIDDLDLPKGNDLLLVKAVVLLFVIKRVIFAFL